MTRPRLFTATCSLIVVSILVVACGGASGSSATTRAQAPDPGTAQTHDTSAAATDTAPASAASARSEAAAAGAAWTTFGGANSRAGIAAGAPAHPKLRRRFARSVDGQIYAQPLIAGGRIYVATQNNTVYAFTTSGRQVWKRHFGAPVPSGDLPCGNISITGITSTPVITRGRIYAVAYLRSGHRHVLYGLSLRNGHVAVRVNVDTANRLAQQQRGALLAAHGRIYIPYGGLFGDCGPFHGYVVSVTTAGGHRITFRDPAAMAGIWAPAGISQQADTQLVSTGNGGGDKPGWENAVIRLSVRLRRLGFWAPTDWRNLSAGDVDTSSLAPLPVSGGRVFQIGKDGIGYLLSNSLGGVGRELHGARVCSGGAFGADAFRAPLAIVPCGGGLYGLRIQGNSFSKAWSSSSNGMVPVIAGDSVFALTQDGTLVQLRMSDGRPIASARVGDGATSFPAPAAAGSTLVAPGGTGFVVFSI